MKEFRYQYQPRKKYTCPNCGQKTLKKFIDTTTGELLPDTFGVCERMFSCGYNNRPGSETVERVQVERPPTIPFYFQEVILISTLNQNQVNVLYSFLAKTFNRGKVSDVFVKSNGRIIFSSKLVF